MPFLVRTIKRALTAAAVALAFAAPAAAATFEAHRGINLDIWTTWPDESRWSERDAILPFPEWRKSVTEADLAALKAAGLDFVRMPVDPSPFLSSETDGLRDDLFASVLESARMANAAGLKVIVDLHLMPAGSNRSIGMGQVMQDPALFDRYVELVRRMGRTLAKEDPSRLAFELMNEPTLACQGAEQRDWEDRLTRIFAAARASATRLTLVLSGSCWGTAEGLAALDPKIVPDANVIWSFHSYAPFLLTHQGATWAGDFIPHVTGLPYPLDALPKADLDAAVETIRATIRRDAPWARRSGMLAYLDEQLAALDTPDKLAAALAQPFELVERWAEKNGVPPAQIILGEFGMIRQEYGTRTVVPARYRAAYLHDMISLAEKRGYAWSMWGYGGAFGVVEEFDGRKAEPDVMDMIRGLGRGG
ncbi:glycoside hydrolase family 5 protein [Mesorhizobium australicum]|uniref:Cellulase (Glycosyl hydrolase family 5) n=1 Tax=Mesorhizobium australicum TaxID=536018 RepID=A0A1X7PVW2_9HYPH|nr:cellulase family glycosylhydrolase [Mesorhizobium australicum]SMH55793.1 Cellulase (glycosyl hydrolase family 5) [Mesorhizobium australicum]